MSSITANTVPLIAQTSTSLTIPDYVTIINPDGSVTYEKNTQYQQPTIIRRSYAKSTLPKHRYTIQQEGKSYRCCQWCRHWCTRNCSMCSFCDRILSCPLITFLLSALLLLLLLTALLTLFGLHPDINPSRRYYGIISALSIYNRTTYVHGLDGLCNKYSLINNCLNLTTSTSVSLLSTTIFVNRAESNSSFSIFLLCSSIIITCIYRIFISNIMQRNT